MVFPAKAAPLTGAQSGNRLLDRLPLGERDDVLARCDVVDLVDGSVLYEAGDPLKYAYFPVNGSISVIRSIDGHKPFETENIGREGMLGAHLILDLYRAPHRALVQTPCSALRLKSKQVRRGLDQHPALRRTLQRYLSVVLAELAQSAACVHFHDVGSRLARDLLVYHDRVEAGDLPLLTHQLLAEMLGVQRGSVTLAAARLQRDGIIRYSRGRIAILDRQGLEAAACGCYRASIENYEILLATPSAREAPQ